MSPNIAAPPSPAAKKAMPAASPARARREHEGLRALGDDGRVREESRFHADGLRVGVRAPAARHAAGGGVRADLGGGRLRAAVDALAVQDDVPQPAEADGDRRRRGQLLVLEHRRRVRGEPGVDEEHVPALVREARAVRGGARVGGVRAHLRVPAEARRGRRLPAARRARRVPAVVGVALEPDARPVLALVPPDRPAVGVEGGDAAGDARRPRAAPRPAGPPPLAVPLQGGQAGPRLALVGRCPNRRRHHLRAPPSRAARRRRGSSR